MKNEFVPTTFPMTQELWDKARAEVIAEPGSMIASLTCGCAVALTVRETLGLEKKEVSVADYIHIYDKERDYHVVEHTEDSRCVMEFFDRGDTAPPCSEFVLDIPTIFLREKESGAEA